MISYNDYIDLVDKTFRHFNWRYGQCIMNVLYTVDKVKYEQLVSTEHDCYYDDSMVHITLDKLEKEWKI